jgi:hypothetical protein
MSDKKSFSICNESAKIVAEIAEKHDSKFCNDIAKEIKERDGVDLKEIIDQDYWLDLPNKHPKKYIIRVRTPQKTPIGNLHIPKKSDDAGKKDF